MVGCTFAQAIQTVPCVAKKAEWAQRWIGSGSSFAERLVGFACVEGMRSSHLFALNLQNILSCMKTFPMNCMQLFTCEVYCI